MENLTELIKKEINSQYGSVKKFAAENGIPYGTINTALFRGVGGSSFDLILKVCRLLGIRQIFDDEITHVNRKFYEMVKKLENLDDQALATINSLIIVETERCGEKQEGLVVKGYNGIGYVGTDERIKKLILEVLKEQSLVGNA